MELRNKTIKMGSCSFVSKIICCGAKAKSTGRPCRIKDIYANGRCKYHGGLSTGPKTEAGKKKSAGNGFKKGWKNKPSEP